jgi:large subunit ribosomal protein L29
MRSRERLQKIRDKSVDELVKEEVGIREQLFKLRFQWAMGQTETLKKLRELRKERARILTIIGEKQK